MPEWFEGLDADHQSHVASKGWNKPLTPEIAVDMARAHRQAQQLIGAPAEQIIRLPKDHTDPSYAGIVERINSLRPTPKAEDYKFDGLKFKDGSAIPDDFAAGIRALATELRLTPEHAARVASHVVSLADADAEAEAREAAELRGANRAALQQRWGTAFDANSFAVDRMLQLIGGDALPKEFAAFLGTLPGDRYAPIMEGMFNASKRLNEAEILRGGGAAPNPTDVMTPDQARQEIDRLKNDREWFTKWYNGDRQARDHFERLNRIVVSGYMAPAAR